MMLAYKEKEKTTYSDNTQKIEQDQQSAYWIWVRGGEASIVSKMHTEKIKTTKSKISI